MKNDNNAARTRTYQYYDARVFEGVAHRAIASLYADMIYRMHGITVGVLGHETGTIVTLDKIPNEMTWFANFMAAHDVEVYD